MAVRLGEKRDGAQRCAVLLIEIAGRVNETHGSFATIHDGHALKFVLHKSPDQIDKTTIVRTMTRQDNQFIVLHAATASSDIAACSAFNARHPRRWEALPCGSR